MTVRKLLRVVLWFAAIVGLVALAFRVLLVRIWTIPGDDPAMGASLAPSVAPGDVVVLLHAGNVGFSDLVRCTDPQEPRRWVIGRVAAEGGDRLTIQSGRVSINGKLAPLEYACTPPVVTINDPNTGSPVELRCDMEDLGGSVHKRSSRGSDGERRIERTVEDGFFYLVSDNRSYALDSRVYGPVPAETCDARIVFRLWGEKGFADVQTRFTFIQ